MPIPLSPGNLSDELARSVAFGEASPGLMPVFVPQGVIDEVLALTERPGRSRSARCSSATCTRMEARRNSS